MNNIPSYTLIIKSFNNSKFSFSTTLRVTLFLLRNFIVIKLESDSVTTSVKMRLKIFLNIKFYVKLKFL
jgi:hypothetical protein